MCGYELCIHTCTPHTSSTSCLYTLDQSDICSCHRSRLYASFSKFVLQPLSKKILLLLRTETTGTLRRVVTYIQNRFDVVGGGSWILPCATCVQIKAIKPPVDISGVDMGRLRQAIAGWDNYCMRPTWRVRVLSNEEKITDAVRLIRRWVSSTFWWRCDYRHTTAWVDTLCRRLWSYYHIVLFIIIAGTLSFHMGCALRFKRFLSMFRWLRFSRTKTRQNESPTERKAQFEPVYNKLCVGTVFAASGNVTTET